jgi:hypothetical protein
MINEMTLSWKCFLEPTFYDSISRCPSTDNQPCLSFGKWLFRTVPGKDQGKRTTVIYPALDVDHAVLGLDQLLGNS